MILKNLSKMDETFLLTEYRLLTFIMTPALIVTYILGIILLYDNIYFLGESYFLIKLFLVKKTKFYRIINEIPTLLMIIIILLVIVKPNFQII